MIIGMSVGIWPRTTRGNAFCNHCASLRIFKRGGIAGNLGEGSKLVGGLHRQCAAASFQVVLQVEHANTLPEYEHLVKYVSKFG